MKYRSLDPHKIADTVDLLRRRIEERFPGSGLGKVAAELCDLARGAITRVAIIQKPNLLLRGGALVLCIGFIAGAAAIFASLKLRQEEMSLSDLVQSSDAFIGSTVFIGAAAVFLLSLDTRWKRRRVLVALHELRSLAHIVDMHQLTKDPELLGPDTPTTASSPKRTMNAFELSRYLDYSSEMLSLISKIAALYVQGFEDSAAIGAVDEIESLTTGLSRKVWQKIMILDRITNPAGR
ncbi:MAG TPA: hypothetical protein VMT52_14745 [Planctomycetota bacterium]|nr:hypothetical protein [Planctomycetota bacterium]